MKRFKGRVVFPFLMAVLLAFGAAQALAAGQEAPSAVVPCENGFAGPYPCANVDLVGRLTLAEMGAGPDTLGNDIWGWTDSVTGKEYVIFGLTDGTAFVDISDPLNPHYLGTLPTHTSSSTWRDMKTYADHAFIVADQPSQHGMQVFDLTQLRTVVTPTTFTETTFYGLFGNGHNMAINEASGFAYVMRSETCSGALHMINIQDPLNPTFAGCFDDDGLTSDTQCLMYDGPDADYQGHEICFTGSDDSFTIGDVTDKNMPVQLDLKTYPGIARAHQGWLTADKSHFILSDTMDEVNFGHNTRTYIWNVSDLDNATYAGYYEASTTSTDHNIYIVDQYAYQTNFQAGFRVLDVTGAPEGNLTEVGYFDVDPDGDSPVKSGAWSSYPWFESGIIPVSDTDQGLFLLQFNPPQPTGVALTQFNGSAANVTAWIFLPVIVLIGLIWLAGIKRTQERNLS